MLPFPRLDFRRTPVTLIVAAVVVAIELVSTMDPGRRDFFYLDMRMGILSPIWSGEVWRPVTTTLLHGNLLHAAFNVYWLLIFGQVLESRMGPARFLGLFVLLGYVTSLPQFLLTNFNSPLDGQQGSVGLSGIMYGLFGILWMGRRWHPEFRAAVSDETVRLLVFWFFFCIVLTHLKIMAVGNIAHGAGLIFGVLYGLAMYSPLRHALWGTLAAVPSVLVLATMIACPGHGLYEEHRALEAHKRFIQQLQEYHVGPQTPATPADR